MPPRGELSLTVAAEDGKGAERDSRGSAGLLFLFPYQEVITARQPPSKKIVREFVDQLLDVLRLVAVGDEDRVAGLHDDEVTDTEEGDAVVLVAEDDVVSAVDDADWSVGLVSFGNGLEVLCD